MWWQTENAFNCSRVLPSSLSYVRRQSRSRSWEAIRKILFVVAVVELFKVASYVNEIISENCPFWWLIKAWKTLDLRVTGAKYFALYPTAASYLIWERFNQMRMPYFATFFPPKKSGNRGRMRSVWQWLEWTIQNSWEHYVNMTKLEKYQALLWWIFQMNTFYGKLQLSFN